MPVYRDESDAAKKERKREDKRDEGGSDATTQVWKGKYRHKQLRKLQKHPENDAFRRQSQMRQKEGGAP